MKRFLIFTGIAVVVIILVMQAIGQIKFIYTKSFSPEEEVAFEQGDLHIEVFYNRPSKKGRKIFGGLVPYDKVWRTGANEATIIDLSRDITIQDKKLKAGKYSLWTIPGEEIWTIIFNAEYGQWGINSDGEANRDPKKDVLAVDVKPIVKDQVTEQFTIDFERVGYDAEMVLLWDSVSVPMPFTYR